MKIFSIDGNTQMLDGGSMFGNAPKALWSKWIAPDESNRIPLATRALLLQTDEGENILFETGIGSFFEPVLKERYGVVEDEHMLLQNLKKIGIKETDIDTIILSHLHFDHAGGLLSAYNNEKMPALLFPNATYYVSKCHWERAQHPHPRDKASFIPIIQNLLQKSNRLCLIEKSHHIFHSIPITFHFSEGHTPGLMLSEISLTKGPLLFVSDLAPGLPWMHLPITMGFDRFPEKLVDEKNALFKKLHDKNGALFFTHDINISCALIAKDEKDRFFGIPTNLGRLI